MTRTTPRIPLAAPAKRLVGALLAAAMLAAGCSGGDDETGSTSSTAAPAEDCENPVDIAEIEYRNTDDLTDLERQTVELFRSGSGPFLLAQNPISCRGMTEAPPPIDAGDVEAFEAKSFVHTDPTVRYDLFYYTGRQPADAARADAIAERLGPAADDGVVRQVWSIGGSLFVATSAPADDETAALIIDHYDRILAGDE